MLILKQKKTSDNWRYWKIEFTIDLNTLNLNISLFFFFKQNKTKTKKSSFYKEAGVDEQSAQQNADDTEWLL